MTSAISVQGLSKRYTLGAGGGYRRLSEVITDRLKRRPKPSPDQEDRHLWALKDVSFEVAEGDVVGIVGRNGAGKSTLLKVLSRITEPTSGRAVLHGRVGALLEVGTGFHPELSGRENIFLNGAILGMRKAEIQRRFDEIVEFADVERFLDTPVKRYSSGMYVRLAFAVAAHLEPEVLVVDEVLAVGDAAFQRKCLGKMGDVARSGRTVLFVSHNMAAVEALCTRGILLDAGAVVHDGSAGECVARYLETTDEATDVSLADRPDRKGSGAGRITDLRITPLPAGTVMHSTSRLEFRLQYEADANPDTLVFAIGIFDQNGAEIYLLDSETSGGIDGEVKPGGTVLVSTGPINLTPGRCYVNVAMVQGGLVQGGEIIDHVERAAVFDVEASDFYGTGRMHTRDWALALIEQHWAVD